LSDSKAINITDAAAFLHISAATIRNWVKSGILITKTEKPILFESAELRKLKKNIENGNISKLNKRANKALTKKTFLPTEYFFNHNINRNVELIVNFIQENKLDISLSLFLLALNLLKKEKLISEKDVHNIYNRKLQITKCQIKKELLDWAAAINITNNKKAHFFLLNCELQNEIDFLGLIYQSLKKEGDKSKEGSYYTPINIIYDIADKYASKESKVLDPCCGTGQFLLTFADKIKNQENLFGYHIDQTAVRIARINLLIK
jgi:type I restriction-modification system DNA methylase subunit